MIRIIRPKDYVYLRRTPHPVIVTRRHDKDYIRVLFYSYYTTITGWGVLLMYTHYGFLLFKFQCTGSTWTSQ